MQFFVDAWESQIDSAERRATPTRISAVMLNWRSCAIHLVHTAARRTRVVALRASPGDELRVAFLATRREQMSGTLIDVQLSKASAGIGADEQ